MKKKLRTVFLIILGLALVASVFFWLPPAWAFLRDRQLIEGFLISLGPWGPVGMIALQALQVALFPIPGFFGMLGGFLFGFLPGLVYSQVGTVLGSMLAFALAKLYGRPLVERLVPGDKLRQVDGLARDKGALFFLIYYWVPYVPKDAMCYVAGLTPVGYLTYLMVAFWGRLPGTVSATLVGAGVWQFNIPLWGWILIGCTVVAILTVAILCRERIKHYILGLVNSYGKRSQKKENL